MRATGWINDVRRQTSRSKIFGKEGGEGMVVNDLPTERYPLSEKGRAAEDVH